MSTARETVRVARALSRLPLTRRRLLSGGLSYAKARQLTRVATTESEAELLTMAEHAPAGALVRILANWQSERDPEGLARRQWEERGCSMRDEPDGSGVLVLRLPVEQMAVVRTVIDTEVMRTDAPADASLAQQRADAALRVIAKNSTSACSLRPQLVLHHRAGQVDFDGMALAPSVADRLICDCDIRVMYHRADGSPADVGRRHRIVTPRLRRLVEERDGGCCTYPGCHARHFLEIHHRIPWNDGGRTDLANLTLRCHYHHRVEHEAKRSRAA